MKDQKEQLQFDYLELKNEIKEKNQEINILHEENKTLSFRIDNELSDMKVEYRIKSEEL